MKTRWVTTLIKTILCLAVIFGFALLTYNTYTLFNTFTQQGFSTNVIIYAIYILIELALWIWCIILLRRYKYRFAKPSFKLVFILVLCTTLTIRGVSWWNEQPSSVSVASPPLTAIPSETPVLPISPISPTKPPTISAPAISLTQKPVINIIELETQIHVLINTEREKVGLKLLVYDSTLSTIARNHSSDMATNNYFDHNNLNGLTPTDRAKLAGYSCHKDYDSYYFDGIAENIFQNWLYSEIIYYNRIPTYNWNSQNEIASSTVEGWMNSLGHRQNILDSDIDKEGIGIAISNDSKVYITQDLW